MVRLYLRKAERQRCDGKHDLAGCHDDELRQQPEDVDSVFLGDLVDDHWLEEVEACYLLAISACGGL